MAYKKFDAPAESVSQSARKVEEAFSNDAIRRALTGAFNRVMVAGAGGTNSTMMATGMGTGLTGGVVIPYAMRAIINGRYGSIAVQAELNLPTGTQASATYVKYLVSSGFGSSGTVTAGNEGTSATLARLPDCPKNHVALGFMEFYTNAAAWPRGGKTNDTPGKCTGTGGTGGTVNAWVDLMHMPIWEE